MALTQAFDKPDFVALAADLAAIKDNWYWVMVACANGAMVFPGWTTTINSASSPQDFAEPDNITLTYLDTTVSPNVTKTIKTNLTWTSNAVTGMVIQFGDGTSSPELATVTGGTLVLSYDGSGNFTGATSA